ncbi:metalloprotease [Candidatus Woesearchaeota archaeon CG10_big_fil_rev_8_21_14_0_10_45_16]|nr:MAG: metalloprotease [Candidatus Woesearchaeota archaeon CG10_big_fil_rev_8_21_14_0_10_45_16]
MYKTIQLGKIKTSRTELVDIAKALLVLSLAFTFVFSNTTLLNGTLFSRITMPSFWLMFLISLFTAGIGFLLHELSHKFVAQKYGCVAEFRAFDQMLFLALGLAVFIGFIFAAPGAVMISGMITRKENGVISAAGPMMNYVLGMVFLGLLLSVPTSSSFLTQVFAIGFQINLWLGLFNMIPFGNLDGYKIFQWNRYVWLAMAAFGVYFIFFFLK